MSAAEAIRRALEQDIEMLVDARVKKFEEVCESPIEVIFGAYVSIVMDVAFPGALIWCSASSEHDGTPDPQFLMMPQYPWQGYRIDWAFKVRRARRPYVFVECDGHYFHERTKEQAEYDRSKDRTIQAANITILRFTGRELLRDPSACCEELLRVLGNHTADQLDEAK